MAYHILTGDCLAAAFKESGIGGDIIVCRECLVEGPVNAVSDEHFWEERAQYLSKGSEYERQFYYRAVKGDLDKISAIDKHEDVCLWFEHDLFCQVNYWFVVAQMKNLGFTNVYRVSPRTFADRKWEGFGFHSATDLYECLATKVRFSKGDFQLGENLWRAYREGDIVALATYSKSLSPCFLRLEEVCKAEVERKRNARPEKTLEEILSRGYTSFNDIYHQFSKKEGIYGFGDAQVNHMLQGIRRG